MAGTVVTLTADHGLALLGGVAMSVATTVIAMKAGGMRKKAGVELPNNYACETRAKKGTDAYKFNLAQRGAHNPLENVGQDLFHLVNASVHFPKLAAGLVSVFRPNPHPCQSAAIVLPRPVFALVSDSCPTEKKKRPLRGLSERCSTRSGTPRPRRRATRRAA
jgi:hypothetical protein